jgi:hypothetical protein
MIYHTGNQWNNDAKCGNEYYPEPDIVQPIAFRQFLYRLIIVIDRLLFQPDSFLVDYAKISK